MHWLHSLHRSEIDVALERMVIGISNRCIEIGVGTLWIVRVAHLRHHGRGVELICTFILKRDVTLAASLNTLHLSLFNGFRVTQQLFVIQAIKRIWY